MSTRRVYDVARELGVPSKELVQRLKDMGVDVKSHASTIGEDVVARLTSEDAAAAPPEQAPAPSGPKQPSERADAAARESRDVVRPDQSRRAAPTRPPARPAGPERPSGPAEPSSAPEEVQAPATRTQAPEAKPAPAEDVPAAGTDGKAGGVLVHHGVTVREFAEKTGIAANEVVKILFRQGSMKSITQSMTDEEVLVVADVLGVEVDLVDPEMEERLEEQQQEEEAVAAFPAEALVSRPPVVTVMGHVDHGKTTVLDKIRETDVAAGEHGGITQHIGAYQVSKDGEKITFIDTPGHEAFTAMRARGAQVTDVAILVVAADDGVMPQTVEAIDHARAAQVPIIVAVNKVDRPDADPVRVRTQLSELGLQPEEWGGDTMFVDISAKEGTHLEDLLTGIALVSEELDRKAVAEGPARGIILEAHLDKGRGPVGTVLVQRGTLRVGDIVVAGNAWGKVRAMLDEYYDPVREAGPSRPVLVMGWSAVPQVGSDVRVVADEKHGRQLAQGRDAARRAAELVAQRPMSLEDLFKEGGEGELTLILKADVQGSAEALATSLEKIDVGDVRLNILHRGVGAVTENDVTLAKASRAIIVAFNVVPDTKARSLAESEGVEIRTYRVIYQAIEDIEKALKGLLAPVFREVPVGAAEIRELVGRGRAFAGCYVTNGEMRRNGQVRLIRDGAVVWEGRIGSLQRFKDSVRTVQQNYECGIGLEGYSDIRVGDVIEAFEVQEIPRG